jgi:uncharacterized phage protein gp47/JayE
LATQAEILALLLSFVDSKYDKRPGSFMYDALAPVAKKLSFMDLDIETVKSKLSIDHLTGDELTQRINERAGITRKAATFAVGNVTVIGTGIIFAGALFETAGGTRFHATETKTITTSGNVAIEADISGSSGNVASDTITLFPVTLTGFTAVTNTAPTADGFEAESDEDLLIRYYERIRTPATSGNKSQYKSWAKEVSGVGDAKALSLWDGDNTVKIVVINADKRPASTQLVSDVQTYIDPGVTGLGDGIAPIGSFVTVVSATGIDINIAVTVTLSSGYTLSQAKDNITEKITTYLKEIAFVESVVSYAKIGSAILASSGVGDYSALTVNAGNANIAIGNTQVAILGTVTVNVA